MLRSFLASPLASHVSLRRNHPFVLRRIRDVVPRQDGGRSRSFSSASSEDATIFPKVAIVGTGPAGCYTAKYLQSALDKHGFPHHVIDLIERQATIGGLVRYGVAPDHPEVKHAITDFEAALMLPAVDSREGSESTHRVRLYGNVSLGKDVQLDELRHLYDVVILAYGCESSQPTGLPGEDVLEGVLSAREFVAWYNGHPDFRHIGEQVSRALLGGSTDAASSSIRKASVVVIGHGNVALDCARVLAKGGTQLGHTDAAPDALAVLGEGVAQISVVGRRGHVQAAFTIKEVRELVNLERDGHGAKLILDPAELALGSTDASQAELELPGTGRPRQRIDKLLREAAEAPPPQTEEVTPSKHVHLRFLLNPVRFEADSTHPTRLGHVVCERTRLEGAPGQQKAVGTGDLESLPAQLALVSIGYRGVSVPGLNFDARRGVVVHERGRIDGPSTSTSSMDDTGMGGLYASGWLKRGPSGIIGTNIPDAKETVATIVSDLPLLQQAAKTNATARSQSTVPSTTPKTLAALLRERHVSVVDWDGYRRIVDREATPSDRTSDGTPPRTKITDAHQLLEVAGAAIPSE